MALRSQANCVTVIAYLDLIDVFDEDLPPHFNQGFLKRNGHWTPLSESCKSLRIRWCTLGHHSTNDLSGERWDKIIRERFKSKIKFDTCLILELGNVKPQSVVQFSFEPPQIHAVRVKVLRRPKHTQMNLVRSEHGRMIGWITNLVTI